jgi:hypothetical protein
MRKKKVCWQFLKLPTNPTWENSLEAKSWAKSWAKSQTFGLKSHLNPRKGAKKDKGLSSCWEKQLVTKEEELVRKKSKCGGQKESTVCCLLVGKCRYKD